MTGNIVISLLQKEEEEEKLINCFIYLLIERKKRVYDCLTHCLHALSNSS